MKQNSVQTHTSHVVPSLLEASNKVYLEKVIYPNDKIVRLAKLVNWAQLDSELGFLFQSEGAPSSRLVLGLLYLQSIENLSFSEVITKWEKAPEWQYFCGGTHLTDAFPLHNASLSIWSRVIGSQGREAMIRALGSLKRDKILH